jgi:hypothetical protein
MRCMITANRRARATIAFFIPRRLAICIAQALSQDHFFDVFTDLVFTISPKRSTQNLQLSTSCRPITPSFGGTAVEKCSL